MFTLRRYQCKIMDDYHRRLKLSTEAELIFQTIEMAKSDEEIDLELCSTPPTSSLVDLALVQQALDTNFFSWKVVKHRHRPQRRYTVSSSPPAPPSTPTSLTASSTPIPSPTASNTTVVSDERERFKKFDNFYYKRKYNRKLMEQQRSDVDLAQLFSEFTITGGKVRGRNGTNNGNSTKLAPEHGVSNASRTIHKPDGNSKIFKLHRNPKEFFRDLDEDSVSAPEYETEEYYRRIPIVPFQGRRCRRSRRLRPFSEKKRMDAMIYNFDTTMSFNED